MMDDFDAKNRILDIQREVETIQLARLAKAGQKAVPTASLGLAFATSVMFLLVLSILR